LLGPVRTAASTFSATFAPFHRLFVMAGHSRPKDGVASLAYARPSTSRCSLLRY
jgi:hypothetical protein